MGLGGGTFVSQNKVLPGTYHNFISAERAFSNLSDRGYVGLPIALDWGIDGSVFTLTAEDLQKNSRSILGYDYTDSKLKGIRDVFKNAHTAYLVKLGEGAEKASNAFAEAKYTGTRGNDVKIVIQENKDDSTKFDVQTYLGTSLVDEQKGAATGADLIANDFVSFKADAVLEVTVGTPLTGGTNGTVNTAVYQHALDALESYGFNTLSCLSSEQAIKDLFIAYTKHLRDEAGAKFQLVGHKFGDIDHEGVIDVQNDVTGDGEEVFGAVYWTAGAQAGVAINKSNTNKLYNGEYTLDMSETKTHVQLTTLLSSGKYVFHRVGDEVRVLEDINTFTSFKEDKNEDFSMNQVIRVLDQIAIDTATLFNTRYLGQIPNDQSGRISLWSDIVTHRRELQSIRAIQNFASEQVTVEQGNSKKSVIVNEIVEPTVAMSQLFITTTVA